MSRSDVKWPPLGEEQKLRVEAVEWLPATGFPPGLEQLGDLAEPSRPPGLESTPWSEDTSFMPLGALDFFDEQEAPSFPDFPDEHEVVISGLPGALLSESFLEAIWQQAGLTSSVVSFRVVESMVSVTLASRCAAEMCVAHFGGRQWGLSDDSYVCAWLESAPDAPGCWGPTSQGCAATEAYTDFAEGDASTDGGPTSDDDVEAAGTSLRQAPEAV